MRKITEIIVHCSATRPGWWKNKSVKAMVNEFRKWHLDRGWSDIGYHYVIHYDGSVGVGRPITRTGAHVRGRNVGTIGICLVGGHGASATDAFEDHFFPAQDKALRGLIKTLHDKYGVVPVTGHNQYSAKGCPGFFAPTWYSKKSQSKTKTEKPIIPNPVNVKIIQNKKPAKTPSAISAIGNFLSKLFASFRKK